PPETVRYVLDRARRQRHPGSALQPPQWKVRGLLGKPPPCRLNFHKFVAHPMRPSELDLENELHIARSTLSENGIARSSVGGLADGPKQRAHRNNRVAEVGTIQDVKHLPAELQRHPLGDPGRLIQVHIPLGEARSLEAVAHARSE